MATRYRRRLYGSYYYRRPYYRRSTRSAKRRAIGNYKAAVQQKDKTDVNLNITHKCSTQYKNTTIGEDNFNTGVYALNIWDLLRRSEFYQSYANMYDQVKINRIKLKLTPTSWSFNTQDNNHFQAITVVSAWDRTGLSSEQIKLISNNVPETGDNMGVIGLQTNTDGLYVVMNEEISTYSSAMTKSLNPGSSFSLSRTIYPSSLAEKSYYVNTADLDDWYNGYDMINSRFIGIDASNLVTGNPNDFVAQDQEVIIGSITRTPAIEHNPAFILEDPSIPFKPTFLLGVQTPFSQNVIQGTNSVVTGPIQFNIEADIEVTFRGLRKAKIVE